MAPARCPDKSPNTPRRRVLYRRLRAAVQGARRRRACGTYASDLVTSTRECPVAHDAGRLPQARRDCVRSSSGHFQLVERTVSANNVVRLVPHDPPTTARWTKRDHGRNGKLAHRCFPLRRIASRPGYWLEFLVALAVVAVAQRRLGPSSSASTSTVDRALPSSAVQARWWSRPTTTTRLPLLSDWLACSAWSRHTTTVKNDASCSRGPLTVTRTWP
jgi:hypothetical protein